MLLDAVNFIIEGWNAAYRRHVKSGLLFFSSLSFYFFMAIDCKNKKETYSQSWRRVSWEMEKNNVNLNLHWWMQDKTNFVTWIPCLWIMFSQFDLISEAHREKKIRFKIFTCNSFLCFENLSINKVKTIQNLSFISIQFYWNDSFFSLCFFFFGFHHNLSKNRISMKSTWMHVIQFGEYL